MPGYQPLERVSGQCQGHACSISVFPKLPTSPLKTATSATSASQESHGKTVAIITFCLYIIGYRQLRQVFRQLRQVRQVFRQLRQVIGNFGKCVVTDVYKSAGVAGFAVPPLSSNLAAVTQKASTLGLQLGL